MITTKLNRTRVAHIERHICLSLMSIIFICLISACSYKWEDISTDHQYSVMIGRIYVTNVQLNVFGIKDVPQSPYAGYYIITVDPGISARYIEKIGILPKESLLKVTNVVKADSSNDIAYIVEILTDVPFKKIKAHIYHMGNTYIKSSNGNNIYILNSKFFTDFKSNKN